MNIARVTPPFGTKKRIHKIFEFHLQPNSSLDKVGNTKPLDHHLDLDESRLQLR